MCYHVESFCIPITLYHLFSDGIVFVTFLASLDLYLVWVLQLSLPRFWSLTYDLYYYLFGDLSLHFVFTCLHEVGRTL